jgi:hypothetical protein
MPLPIGTFAMAAILELLYAVGIPVPSLINYVSKIRESVQVSYQV